MSDMAARGVAAERKARTLGGAFALALLLEAAIVASALLWLDRAPPPADSDKPSLEVSLVTLPPAPAPPPPPPVPQPEPPPPQPVPQPSPKPPPPKPAPRRKRPPPKIVKPVEAPNPETASVQYPAAPAPSVPAPRAPSADAMASFDSKVRAAVEAAVRFPYAAEMMRQYGRARVEFDYRDGAVSSIRLVQSSGFALLDPAALAAVRDARYPPPPPELRGRALHYVVWVRFRAEATQ